MRRRLVPVSAIALLALLALLAVGLAPTAAQEAGPPGGLDFPDPAGCTVEPRTVEELRALFRAAAATPAADASPAARPTPAALPAGEPADDQTVAEVDAAWREFIACINAGDFRRTFALVSDDKLRRDFAQDFAAGETEDSLIGFFAATPAALEPDHRAPFIALTDMRVLPDGRVAAVGPGETGQGEVLIFVAEGGRWLVDDQFDRSPPATPTA